MKNSCHGRNGQIFFENIVLMRYFFLFLDTPGWPFPNYSWNEEGEKGQISQQPCPDGQSGEATWECGDYGEWQ